jgi:hypothetical protein
LRVIEERTWIAFEKRVLRRIFGTKKEEVIGGWSELHNKGLHNLYCLSDITVVMKLGK